MHGVGADDDGLRSGGFEASCRVAQKERESRPIVRGLEALDEGEVEGVDHAWKGMEMADVLADVAVQQLVVESGAFPGHAAEETEGLHDGWKDERLKKGRHN